MGVAAGVSAGLGAVGGTVKFFEGRKMQKKAQKMLDNFKWQDLQNPYENLQVSTLGADLQREEAGRNTASIVNTIQSGGSRAIIGGLGRVQAQNNLVNRQIAADLDQQQKDINYAKAQDDTNIRAMIEQRQSNELQGYGQMLNVGMNMKYDGMADVMNAVGSLGQSFGGIGEGKMGAGSAITPTQNSFNSQPFNMNPQSMNSASLYAGNYGMS